MSYNIHQQPGQYRPAYNDLIFVVSSSNNAQLNFNYFADIYIVGVTDPIRLKAPVHPTYGSGVFNAGRVIENYVNSDISKTTYGFQKNLNSFASYRVDFGEEYGPSSGVIQYSGITSTAYKYVWNGVLDFLDVNTYTMQSYSADSGTVLSENIDRYLELTQDAWLYFYSNDTTSYDTAHVLAYNSTGGVIRGVEIANPYTSSGTIGNHFLRFSSGANNLNMISSGSTSGYITSTIGSGLIIPANTYKYTIQFDGASASPYFTHYITTLCKYPTNRLHFLNELGAFESFNFTKLSKKKIDVTRSKYKAPYGALTSASSFSYNNSDRLERTFFTSMKEGLSLKSDWITEAEHEWLQELITSPEIYLDDPTFGLVAVSCNINTIDVKTVLNDKLFNLSIDLEYSFNRYRQRY